MQRRIKAAEGCVEADRVIWLRESNVQELLMRRKSFADIRVFDVEGHHMYIELNLPSLSEALACSTSSKFGTYSCPYRIRLVALRS